MNKLLYLNNEKVFMFDNNRYEMHKLIGNIDIDEISFNYLKFLESQEIEGYNLEDLILYDKIPLYYLERSNILLKLKHLFTCFVILEKICSEFGNDFMVHTDDITMYLLASKVFSLICDEVISQRAIKGENTKITDRIRLVKVISHRFFFGIKSIIKFKVKHKHMENFLILSHAMDINLIKSELGNKLFDTQLGPIVEYLHKKNNILNIQFTNDFYNDKTTQYHRENYMPFEFFILYKKFKRHTIIKYNLLSNNLSRIKNINFKYKNYDLKTVIIGDIFCNLEEKIFEDLREVLTAESLILKLKIRKCLVINEGDRNRSFIIASNMQHISSYAVQHGIINKTSSSYIINSKYKDILTPKVFFVWGEKYQNLLINNTNIYTIKNTKIVGQVRTDLLYKKKKENIMVNKKNLKILYATQYLQDLLEPATIMLLKALKFLEYNYELIIKLHPADKNYNFYQDKLKDFGISNSKIVIEDDLYDLLEWCDVIVSVHSTVVLEGAILNKPSICILLPKYNDAGSFVRDGISSGAKDEYELSNLLYSCFNNNNVKLTEFISRNFYKVDGKVVERIVDEIGD